LTLVQSAELSNIAEKLKKSFAESELDFKSDLSGKLIGKKYSLMDEIGVNFSIVIDYGTVRFSPPTVTVRDRDTVSQIRVSLSDIPELMKSLTTGQITFSDAEERYLSQEEFLANAENFSKATNLKAARNSIKYSERDIGQLLSSLAEVSVQLDNPELLLYVHNFKRAMNR
jgi:hypothetical protein